MVSLWCSGTLTTTATTSRSASRNISRWSWKARGAPNFAADSLAVSAWAVHTAASSNSGRFEIAGMWARGVQP